MAFSRNHSFVSAIADDSAAAAAGEVLPSHWNAAFKVSGATVGGIPYCPTATSETTSAGLTFDGTNLISLFKATGSGTAAAPAFWIPDVVGAAGIWQRTSGFLDFAVRGVNYMELYADGNGNGYLSVASAGAFCFASGAVGTTGGDTCISRISAGIMAVGTGAAGSTAGRLQDTSTTMIGVAIGSLNASPTIGEVQSVTDSLNPTIGSTVAAGGSAKALVWWNGANWTVIGK